MKSVLNTLLSTGIKAGFAFVFDLVKDEVMPYYRRTVEGLRQVFNTWVFAVAFLMLMLSGFLAIHVGLYILAPWSESTKGLVLLILGLIYFFVPIGILSLLLSKRVWVRLFKAD